MAFLIVKLVAGICAISAIIVALVHIFNHLRNYTEPTYQRYTVRIIFMVPVYAAMSYLSLLMPDKSIYFDSFRDIYEAWVIYNFMSLCLAWVGGPGAVVTSLAGRFLKPSWHLMTCCFPAIPLDGRFIRRCKQGCLQFVILKPLMAIATLWMYFKEKYSDGSFKASSGSLYVTLIYTASYTTALCALLLFYFACKELLRPFKPLPKFIIIKSVVFLTYWQGVFVGLMVSFGMIRGESDSADLQNFLICMEMLAAAIGHLYAFPYKEYAEANVGSSGGLLSSISHAINFNDVVHDTMHQFAPTYHNYVLYSDGSQEAPTKYRARTFVKTGQEMETLRTNRNIGQSSKLDEGAYSSGLSSSEGGSPVKGDAVQNHGFRPGETFKNALLTDEQFAHAYDMSPLDVSSGHSKVAQYNSPGEPSGHSKAPQYNPPEAPSGHSKAAQYNSPNAPSGPSKPPQYNSAASSGNPDPRNHIVVDFDPRKHTKPDGNQQTPRSSGLDSRRRSSTGEDAFEETRLTDRRRSSHGVLMEEIDYVGEEQAYHEGYVQQ